MEVYAKIIMQRGEPAQLVNIADPRTAETVDLFTVCLALARQQRFGCQLAEGLQYDNATHSWNVAVACEQLMHRRGMLVAKQPSPVVFAALVHDFPEGLGWGDVISPIKQLMASVLEYSYQDGHNDCAWGFAKRFGLTQLTMEELDLVKEADTLTYLAEDTALRGAPRQAEFKDAAASDIYDFMVGIVALSALGFSQDAPENIAAKLVSHVGFIQDKIAEWKANLQ